MTTAPNQPKLNSRSIAVSPTSHDAGLLADLVQHDCERDMRDDLDCPLSGITNRRSRSMKPRSGGLASGPPAYRDLKFSLVSVDGRKLSYVDLMNHV